MSAPRVFGGGAAEIREAWGVKEDSENAAPAGYRRSVGTPRAQARRRELLELVTDDLAAHGLVDLSLRRAAKAAGTTHKVLLYHFDGAEDLLREAVELLRERRLASSLAAAFAPDHAQTLAGRVRAVWPVLTGTGEGQRALDQALGLAMYDPERHAALAVDAAGHFLPALREMCPPQWSDQHKDEIAELVFAALRGFLVQRRTGGSDGASGGEAGFEALLRMLEREEAAG
ncbi:TetR/AcrR family transcriptional regulator [Catenulispora pinisilvae]|uniref:TetR/AcrR family transcriptional regulator n=1 Tax=Catenulispora pinisilvae TaxID=2705253 RepID=UPI001E5DF494|nr:TetR/AcrR family transcriptional regulator [Catenulispora pinisilvae]